MLSSPDPLRPLPTGWENTERIASLYSQVLIEPVSLPVRTYVASTRWRSIGPHDDSSGHTIHSHRFDCNWLKLMSLCKSSVFTAPALLRVVCSCASFHRWPIQVYPSKNFNTRVIPEQTPTTNKRENWYDPYPLSNSGCSRTDGRLAL